ncbi:MAG TPA: hypothetical protein VHW09_25785 [Bryobacteraceae bacterium]|nr:hypothetical protein [Bryobacteraceae bacterium]
MSSTGWVDLAIDVNSNAAFAEVCEASGLNTSTAAPAAAHQQQPAVTAQALRLSA